MDLSKITLRPCKQDSLVITGIIMAFLAVLVYVQYGFSNPRNLNFYAKLGNAFLAGQTALLETPPQELLELENPYNYYSRMHMRLMWDSSLYNGKYYLYFGPAPVIFPWIPVYLLTGIQLNDKELCVLLTCLGSVCLIGLIITMSRLYPNSRIYAVGFSLLALCFGTWIPLLLSRPLFYEVAIAGAYFYTALGLLCLWRSIGADARHTPYWQLLASFSLGMAAGSRLFFAIAMIIPACMWFQASIRRRASQSIKEGFLLCTPWVLCIGMLGLYNYVRFDSVFENGFSYQITGRDFHKSYAGLWQSYYFWSHAYDYLFKPVPISKITPWAKEFGVVTIEPAYGLFYNSPFSLWSLWLLGGIWTTRKWQGRYCGLIIGLAIFTLGISYFIFCFDTVINRYMVDFSPWVMLLAAVGFLQAMQIKNDKLRKHLLIAGGLLAIWTAYVGLANSYCGFGPCK